MPIPDFQSGERLEAAKLNEAMAELAKARSVSTTGDFDHTLGVEGTVTRRVDFPFVWGKILESQSVNAPCGRRFMYRWQQVSPDCLGCFEDTFQGYKSDPFPSSGDQTVCDALVRDMAYEANEWREPGTVEPVAVGTIVILWPGRRHPKRPEWLFVAASKDSGTRDFIWVALMERSGSLYSGIWMRPGGGSLGYEITAGCSPTFSYEPNWCAFNPVRPLILLPDGSFAEDPTGVVPIYPLQQENCRSDNCQGGKHPEIVKAYPVPGVSVEDARYWLFAYGDAQEEDDERQVFLGPDTWLRDDAVCKGFIVGIVGAIVTL